MKASLLGGPLHHTEQQYYFFLCDPNAILDRDSIVFYAQSIRSGFDTWDPIFLEEYYDDSLSNNSCFTKPASHINIIHWWYIKTKGSSSAWCQLIRWIKTGIGWKVHRSSTINSVTRKSLTLLYITIFRNTPAYPSTKVRFGLEPTCEPFHVNSRDVHCSTSWIFFFFGVVVAINEIWKLWNFQVHSPFCFATRAIRNLRVVIRK